MQNARRHRLRLRLLTFRKSRRVTFATPGVRFLQQTITAINPEARTVTTDGGVHEADYLVVALGADYDLDATPGLADGDNEFYSVPGAERLGELLTGFSQGRAIVGV